MENPANYLHVTSEGDGNNPVIFFHGLWGGGNYFRDFARDLLDLSPKYYPDQIGFGNSSKPNTEYTLRFHSESIHNALPQNQQYTLIGNSYGATLALAFAKYFPTNTKRIILISPILYKNKKEAEQYLSTRFIPKITMFYPTLGNIICTIMCTTGLLGKISPLFTTGMKKKFITGSTKHTWQSYYSTFVNGFLKEPLISEFETIVGTIPTLIIYGGRDNYINPFTITTLKSDFVTIKELKNENHNLLFERYQNCKDIIAEWIKNY